MVSSSFNSELPNSQREEGERIIDTVLSIQEIRVNLLFRRHTTKSGSVIRDKYLLWVFMKRLLYNTKKSLFSKVLTRNRAVLLKFFSVEA